MTNCSTECDSLIELSINFYSSIYFSNFKDYNLYKESNDTLIVMIFTFSHVLVFHIILLQNKDKNWCFWIIYQFMQRKMNI